jgi:hypothetical protein
MKKTKNRITAGLIMTVVFITSLGAMPVGAELEEGYVNSTIDDLWTTLGSTRTTINDGEDYSDYMVHDSSPCDYKFITADYEDGVSGNVVLKSGNGTDNRGIFSYNELHQECNSLLQRWEVKIKLSSITDIVDAMTYSVANSVKYRYADNIRSSAITFSNGSVYIKEKTEEGLGTSIQLASGITASQWYQVVRYIDFSTDNKQFNRVLIYRVDNNGTVNETKTLIADSGSSWIQCGADPVSYGNKRPQVISFDVSSAISGPVMFDDLAIYEEILPTMSFIREYQAENYTSKTIDDIWAAAGNIRTTYNTKIDSIIAGYYYVHNMQQPSGPITVDKESVDSDNIVLKSCNEDNTAFTGFFAAYKGYALILEPSIYQKWEVKVKLADLADDVTVLQYGHTNYPQHSDYNNYNSGIRFNDGNIYYTKRNAAWNAEHYKIATDIEANQWYQVVRYMDCSESGVQYNRALIYRVDNNGTANESKTLIADTGETWVKNGFATAIRNIACYVTSANIGPVMFDDFFVYPVESFDVNSDVSINNDIVMVNFSKTMDADSLNTEAISFTENGIEKGVKSANYDTATNIMTIEFNELRYEKNYILTIGNNVIADSTGLYPQDASIWSFSTASDPLVIGDRLFKNAADENISSQATTLNSGEQVKASVALTNTTSGSRDYLVILALYEGDKMVGASARTGSLSNTESDGIQIETDLLTVANNGTNARIFVWDNWNKVSPLIERIALPVE